MIEIVDGQQRLATTSILIAAIRDHLFQIKEQETAVDLERKYLKQTVGMKDKKQIPNLTLSEVDNDYFRCRVLSRPDSSDRNINGTWPSHRLLSEAAVVAKEFISEITGSRSIPEKLDILDTWIAFLDKHAKVIFILVPDASDAFVIFETLNDRGLDLTIADLTKVYLFGTSGNRIGEVRHSWSVMVGRLASFNENDITKTYIHQLWSSLNGVTRDKEIFNAIRKSIYGEEKAVTFAKQLSENSAMYSALRNSDSDYWEKFGSNARIHISILNKQLRVSQIRTLLLAVISNFSDKEIKKLLPYCVSWSVRFLVAGGSPGNLESYYAGRAIKIRKGEIKNASDLVKSMESLVPNDNQFKAAFESESHIPEYRARYFLACLERAASKEASPHLAQDDELRANLEHILPKSADLKLWKLSSYDHDRLTHRLGNLALLEPLSNSGRGNGTFKEAIPFYSKSAFLLTKSLTKFGTVWDEKCISIRQKELAELAVKTWPIS
jgi:hypothetical protein